MNLFKHLDIETMSCCNRHCRTCIRNSHPDSEAIKDWFVPTYLSVDVIKEALEQSKKLGFAGTVCLSHFNEPLMDERLPRIGELAKSYFYTYCHTNGDFLSDELVKCLDGKLDSITVSLYQDEPIKSKRAAWVETLFKKTKVQIITQSAHIITHFSPNRELQVRIQQNVDNKCGEPEMHCIINHRRQFLLCCEDVIGNFDLGTFPETSIEEYWFGEKHVSIYNNLSEVGGRHKYAYCEICPK